MGLAIKSTSTSGSRRQSTVWGIRKLDCKTSLDALMLLPELTTLRTDSLKMASALPYRISNRSRQSSTKPTTTLWLLHIRWVALCTQPQLRTFRLSSLQTTVTTILLQQILVTFAIRMLLRPCMAMGLLFQIDHLQLLPRLMPNRVRNTRQCQLLKSKEATVNLPIYAWRRTSIVVWEEACSSRELIVEEVIFRQVEETLGTTKTST